MDKLRIDKWLWVARFYKTRSLAALEIDKGRVRINGQEVKPAREVKPGDRVALRQGTVLRTLVVRGITSQRGAAPVAQQLYKETSDSLQARKQTTEQHRFAHEPALSIGQGRPTKRERRKLEETSNDWDERWSASIMPNKDR